ncbi:DUF4232 domain-containing protein [Kitasatospora sp. NPDC050543]|uniref:DUF4232 domain-containing protein n=1 Tax=Kitasatospora sp. NPDC050543 TaxID=3364054 RepID=UPI00379107C3
MSDAPRTGATGGPPPQVCGDSGILTRVGAEDAAMGLRVMTVELVNCGTEPYRLNGYPRIRVLDKARRPLAVEIGHGTAGIATIEKFDPPARPVTLRAGERATVGLVWRNTVTLSDVPAAEGRFIEITLPDGQPRQVVAADLDLGNTGRLGVSAWAVPTVESGPASGSPSRPSR